MSVTLTARPDAARHAVDLALDAGGQRGTLLALTRTDANGSRDVRLPAGASSASTFETIYLADFEAVLSGVVQYTATVKVGTVTSSVDATVETSAPAHLWVLHPAVLPEAIVSVLAGDYQPTRGTESAITWPIGRPSPVVNRSPLRSRSGVLTMRAETYEQVAAIEAVASTPETLCLRQTDFPGVDAYLEVLAVTVRPDLDTAMPGRVHWTVDMQVQQVDPPSGPLLAATTWTYRTVAETLGTYRAVTRAYPRYRDLLIGPAS